MFTFVLIEMCRNDHYEKDIIAIILYLVERMSNE